MITDYFLHAPTEESYIRNFKRVVDDILLALESGEFDKEHQIFILFRDEVKRLEQSLRDREITPVVFKRQIQKLGDGDFDFDKFVSTYFGLGK